MGELLAQDPSTGNPPQPATENTAPPAATTQYDESWLGSLLRPLLVIVLVTCINVAAVAFLRQYAPGMGAVMRWTMLAFGVTTTIVGVTTTIWLAHPGQRLRRTATYRVAEIVLLLLVARGVIWLAQGHLPSLDLFLNHPDEAFLDGPYLLTVLAVLLTWFSAIDFTDDLAQLALQPDELYMASLTGRGVHDTTRPAQTDRPAILRRFVARWVGWGVFLLIIASALRLGVARQAFWTLARQDVDPFVIGVIVVYFLIGLLLISQGQLAVLRARWTLDRLPIGEGILRNWPIYTLVVLVIIAALAALLPLGDTILISRVLATVLDALYWLMSLIFQLVSLLLILLLSLLPASHTPPPAEAPPAAAAALPPPASVLEIPAWVGGAFFWATMFLILVVAAYFYFSDKETNLRWLHRLIDMLRLRWDQLTLGWRAWRRAQTLRAASRLLQPGGAGAKRRWWSLRWGALNPEQQVRYLYFQMLNQAANHDKPRHAGETPVAYAPRLSQAFATQEEEDAAIRALTDAFVQVRYAAQPVASEQVSWLARAWERLRQAFGS